MAAVIRAWKKKLKENGASKIDRLEQSSVYRKWIKDAEIEGLGEMAKPAFTDVWVKMNEKALQIDVRPKRKRDDQGQGGNWRRQRR
eukprot:gnl/MRDRNA2_/MRDRNA2_123367_c0_seq1.p1 gnl/MRDRNA2_/MRDRNA2_123367_c0~~gnl/MRDRNA2_/MRDRNA2_123367_c0_seq1.p1  ORF type:complete len:101 (-),score=32.97 gnl/MRDRNA2_/MRDRNA2_123367_c0_seq1:48-305(-)